MNYAIVHLLAAKQIREILCRILFVSFLAIAIPASLSTQGAANEVNDPALISTVPLPGSAEEIAPQHPSSSLLFVAIGRNKDTLGGLAIIDVREPKSPTLAKFIPLIGVSGVVASSDDKTVIVEIHNWSGPNGSRVHELIGYDISNQQMTREKWRLPLSDYFFSLSPDARFLAIMKDIREASLKKPQRKIEIYSVEGSKPELYRTYELDGYMDLNNMNFSTDSNWIVVTELNSLSAYRIDNDKTIKWWCGEPGFCLSAITSTGHSFAMLNNRLGIFKIDDNFLKIGFLPEMFNTYYCKPDAIDADGQLFIGTENAQLLRINIQNPEKPFVSGIWPSGIYEKMLAPGKDNLFYVSLKNGLGVVDLTKLKVSANALKEAHEKALIAYGESDKVKWPRKAIEILQKAGVSIAMVSLPEGLRKVEAGRIFNDYGFMLSKINTSYRLHAIQAIKRAIELDPGRVVAYLNLGDALRLQLQESDNFEAKLALTREIIDSYKKYVSLGGKLPKRASDFLAMNLVVQPPKDVCSTVVSYANAARLQELFGSGSGVEFKKEGKLRLEIKVEGTSYCSNVSAYNAKTNEPVEIDLHDGLTCSPQELNLVPFTDGHYLLVNDAYPVKITPIGKSRGRSCEFVTSVRETASNMSKEPELCRLLQTKNRPKFINFNTKTKIEDDISGAIEERYAWTEITGSQRIDINNDGRKERVLKLSLDSSASVGCHAVFYELVDDNRSVLNNDRSYALMQDIQRIEYINKFYVSVCDNAAGWFVYKGKVYFENKSKDVKNQFHDVWKIEDGKAERVCEFDYRAVTEID